MSLSVTTTYSGKKAGKYISAALLNANTIANGGVRVMKNIKFKAVVRRIQTSGLIQDNSCDFTKSGAVTKTEVIIEPKRLKVNLEMCKDALRDDWDGDDMGDGLFDSLPKEFQDHVISQILGEIAKATELNIWEGTKGTGTFNGLHTLAAAHSDTVKVTGHAVITATNVVAELGKVVDLIPPAIYNNPDLKIYVSQYVQKLYVRALGNKSNEVANNQNLKNGLQVDGVNLFVANGLQGGNMVATVKDNLVFGTGLQNNFNKVQVIDMEKDGEENVRFIVKYTADTQLSIPEQIVVRSTKVA